MKRNTKKLLAAMLSALLMAGAISVTAQSLKHREENRQLASVIASITPQTQWKLAEENIVHAELLCFEWGTPCPSAAIRYEAPTVTKQMLEDSMPGTIMNLNEDCLDSARTIRCSGTANLEHFSVRMTVRKGDEYQIGYSFRPNT